MLSFRLYAQLDKDMRLYRILLDSVLKRKKVEEGEFGLTGKVFCSDTVLKLCMFILLREYSVDLFFF